MSYARNADCSGRRDPVTVVFYGQTAHNSGSLNHFAHQSGWRGSSGRNQGFKTGHNFCRTPQSWQRDSGCGVIPFGACSRYHGRAGQSYHYDSLGRWETVFTPHWEDVSVECFDHKVPSDGFIRGRRQVNSYFRISHHNTVFVRQGNTDPTLQCRNDADERRWVRSDGLQLWIAINGSSH